MTSNRFKNIILIDDDEAVTFYNNYVLKNAEKADKILVANNVDDAIKILNELNTQSKDLKQSLALIDVNMPKYNGFELVEKNYDLFSSLQSKGVSLVFLSTSSNPNDIKRVKEIEIIETFLEKPIDLDKIESLNYLFDA